jgi:hypothetical protein
MMQYVYMQCNLGFPWQKQHSTKGRLIHQQIGLKIKEETSKVLHCVVLKSGHRGK